MYYDNIQNKTSIKNLSPENRPREKIRKRGVNSLNDRELIAVILGRGTKKINVLEMSDIILEIISKNGIENLIEHLHKINGLGESRIYSICAALEFSRRILIPDNHNINKPEDLYYWVRDFVNRHQEHFIVFSLNGANEIIKRRIVTIGLLNSSQVHPREVFADPITDRAASIIIAHNHPSGKLEPSPEDIRTTQKISKAGDILGIPVLDHIIFSPAGFLSLLEMGYM